MDKTFDADAIANELQQNFPFFCEPLLPAQLLYFINHCRLIVAEPGEVIAEIGGLSSEFYLVLDNTLGIYIGEPHHHTKVGQFMPGHFAGTASFFDDQAHELRLAADSKNNTRLLAMSKKMYQRLGTDHPAIAVHLLEFMLRSMDDAVLSASKQMAKQPVSIKQN